jgi:hypothetical protein
VRTGGHNWQPRAAVPAVLLSAVLLGSGCSTASAGAGGDLPTSGATAQPGNTGPASSAPAAAPSTPTVNRADPMVVYRGWWKALQDAYAAGDSTGPELALYGADPILTRQRNEIRALRTEGVVQRTRFTLAPAVTHQDENLVELIDCVRGPSGTYYDVDTGKPRAPKGYRNDVPTRDALRVLLRKRAGNWYVVATTSEGVPPC